MHIFIIRVLIWYTAGLGCVRKGIAIRLREMVLPLSSALVWHIRSADLILGSQDKRDVELLEQAEQRATKMV